MPERDGFSAHDGETQSKAAIRGEPGGGCTCVDTGTGRGRCSSRCRRGIGADWRTGELSLIEALKDEDKFVRLQAALALKRLGMTEALKEIEKKDWKKN